MADVKFMDLSQNDNPATTDSVLIGNSTNGLKRTTVGAIGNLFAVKGLLHFEEITGQTDPSLAAPDNKKVTITAPDVSGYTFAFWLSSSSYGDTMATYVEIPNFSQTHVWIVNSDVLTTPVQIKATAVYVNSTVA